MINSSEPLNFNDEVDSLFLMGNPLPVLSIVMSYLYFVLKKGPDLMKDRKPFNIKYLMLAYNLFQTVWNAALLSRLFTTPGAITYLWKHCCHPLNQSQDNLHLINLRKALYSAAWAYFFSKVVDLFDTIFFVLRKKQSHITFLHVYHHTNMVVSTWAYLKYIRGEQGVIVGIINSFVHIVMYAYYFLSALGPEVQKYLWWKKYITKLQMAQFVLVISYMTSLLVAKCELPKAFSMYIIFNGIIFLVLFANFYIQTYIKSGNKGVKTISYPQSNGTSVKVKHIVNESYTPIISKMKVT